MTCDEPEKEADLIRLLVDDMRHVVQVEMKLGGRGRAKSR